VPTKPASHSARTGRQAAPNQRRDGHTPALAKRKPAATRRKHPKPDPSVLKRLVDHLPDIVFKYRLQPKPGYEYISPAVEALVGYKPEEFYADPELDEKIIDPEYRPALLKAIARRDGVPIKLKWRHKRSSEVWIEVNAVPVMNRKGQVIGLEGVARDVTGRVSAEEHAQEVQAFASAIMSAASDPVAVTDAKGTLIACNEAFASSYGKKPSQLRGLNVADIWSPEVVKRRLRFMRRVVRTGKSVRVEDTTVRGRYFDIAIEPIKSHSGTVSGLAILAREITKRKRAEQRLKASEERYRFLFQDNPTMYFTVSAGGKVLSVNQFGAQQLGYEPEDLTGRPVLDVFHPEDRDAVSTQMEECLRDPGRVHDWEFRKQRKGGETIWVKEAARATEGPDGSPIVLIVCEDITERKRIEQELQQAREELENRVEKTLERDNPYDLTFRQLTVLHLVAQGKSDREIGLALGISPLTVNTHVSRALRKMGASSRTEAGVRALREGLIR
jgi:PAS domain S-box-containing protein